MHVGVHGADGEAMQDHRGELPLSCLLLFFLAPSLAIYFPWRSPKMRTQPLRIITNDPDLELCFPLIFNYYISKLQAHRADD